MMPEDVRRRMKVVWTEEPYEDDEIPERLRPKKLKATTAIEFRRSVAVDKRDAMRDPEVRRVAERTVKDKLMRDIYGDVSNELMELIAIALKTSDFVDANRIERIQLGLRMAGLIP